MLEATVTRKGQVTIPVTLRRKYGLREGMKVDVTESDTRGVIVVKPVLRVKDWAGSDTGKFSYSESVQKLDRLRRKWR